MRAFRAKYAGTCRGCGGAIKVGDVICAAGGRGGYYHGRGYGQGCAPSDDPQADAEYRQGRAEAERYMSDRAIYGTELAEQWEMERELREGW